jgi:hypothetical protein
MISALSALLLFFAIVPGFSQQYFMLGKVSEVKEVKTRPVVVMLEEEDPKLVKKFSKKPQELAAYREEIKRVNTELPLVVSKLWVFNAVPTLKTRSEIERLRDEKNKEFDVIQLNRIEVTDYTKNGMFRYAGTSKTIATISIDLIEKQGRGNPVYYLNLPNAYPTQGDMALGIQMMQNFLQARLDGKKRNEISDESDENKTRLAGKTLLIDKMDIKGGLTQAQIKEAYPYPFKLVDYQTIETAILERDKNYAVVQIIPLMTGVEANAHVVMSTEDGKSLAYYAPIQATVMGKNSEARISQRHLKNYAK